MNRIEKAKEAIEKIEHCIMNDKCELLQCGYYATLPYIESLLKCIENMEIVVRCKDCKWYSKGSNESDSWALCRLTHGQYSVYDDFYCAHGEIKEDIN